MRPSYPKLEPAASVIDKFGGPKVVAEITGKHLLQVYRWRKPKEAGGLGGIIPHWHHETLLKAAKARGIELGAADLHQRFEDAA